jgi:hypothetical protein
MLGCLPEYGRSSTVVWPGTGYCKVQYTVNPLAALVTYIVRHMLCVADVPHRRTLYVDIGF